MPFDALDSFADSLLGLADDLESADPLFATHQARYLQLARTVAQQVLRLLKPEDTDPADWQQAIAEFSELIFPHSWADGFALIYSARDDSQRPAAPREIGYDDVLSWVTAGVENGGKDVTAQESAQGRNAHQIAHNVHEAIRQARLGFTTTDYSRITARLEEWTHRRFLAPDMRDALDAILDAWTAALFPVISRDMEDWFDDSIQRM